MADSNTYQQTLIQDTLGLVTSIATRVREALTLDLDLDELIALGREGLVQAARRFDPARGVSFSSYAYHRIKGAIYDGLRRQGWLSKTEYGHFHACANAYVMNLGDRAAEPAPTPEERVNDLASTLDDLAAIFIVTNVSSQEAAGVDARDGLEALEEKRQNEEVRRALDRLPERERRVLELYYFSDRSLEETGRELGLSKSWASRLHARAVRLMAGELAHLQEEYET